MLVIQFIFHAIQKEFNSCCYRRHCCWNCDQTTKFVWIWYVYKWIMSSLTHIIVIITRQNVLGTQFKCFRWQFANKQTAYNMIIIHLPRTYLQINWQRVDTHKIRVEQVQVFVFLMLVDVCSARLYYFIYRFIVYYTIRLLTLSLHDI